MAKDYDVGYGRPPKDSRFKKGQSGNPGGRPTGSPNLQTEMKCLLAAKTNIKVKGVVQAVPTSKALCLALLQKAMSGDVRAFSKIAEIVGPEMADEMAKAARLALEDFEIVEGAIMREKAAEPPDTVN
jgi:hypothetical protein